MEKKQELAYIDSTLKLLRKGKFELTGEEAIIFNGCFQYLVRKLNELNKPDLEVVPVKEPIESKKGKKSGN